MNDQTDSPHQPKAGPYERPLKTASGTSSGHFPKKMLVFTGLMILLIVLSIAFISEVEDMLGAGLDIVNVISMFGAAITLVLWVGWFLVLSRWRWWKRILASILAVSLPFVFVFIFGPVLGGDLTIQRWEPIWASRPEAPSTPVDREPITVDLSTETRDDFPMFLGANRNGTITTNFQFDVARFSSATQLWKQPIGSGWSGFAARNGYAVTMEQRGDQECITCYSIETGQLQWLYQHKARHQDVMNLGHVGPRTTPTIFDGRVYAVGAVGNCVCLNGADGSVVWQADLNEILGIELGSGTDQNGLGFQYEKNTPLAWGRSGSPLIVGDNVIVPGGGPAGNISTLLAFDRLTGEIRWRGGREMIAYGSPVQATVAGQPQILLTAESKVMGFDPDTGVPLWNFSRPGESDAGANTSQVSVVSESLVLTSNGYPDGGGQLIELRNAAGKISATSVWQNARVLKTKLTSPVILNGHAYSLSNGFLECARLSDGSRIWKQRGRFGHGQVLLVNDQILVHSESGTLYLVRATPDGYEELGQFSTISGICWNTLSLYGNRILLRSEIEAACFELPTSSR